MPPPIASSVEASELTRLFRRGFATTFAIDLLTKVMTAATVVVLIRGLNVPDYAYVTLFLTFAQFAGSAAGGGVRTGYLREEAERVSRGREASLEDPFLRSLLRTGAILVGLALLALPIVRLVGLAAHHEGRIDPEAFTVYVVLFAAGVAAAELAVARYQARRRFLTAGVVTASRAAALLAAALLIVLTGDSVTVISIWLVVAMLSVGAVSTAPAVVKTAFAQVRPRLREIRLTLEESWLSVYYLAAAGFAFVDVMVAGALLNAHQVASLGAALRYVAIAQSPIPALAAILRVRTSQVDVVDSAANQRAMILGWLRRTTLPAVAFVACVAVLAPFIIPHIDGGKYPDSITALQIFLVTALSAYLTAPSVSILMAQRRYTFLAATYGLGLVLNAVGDVAVAPTFGIIGIAVVSSSVYVAIDAALISRALAR